MRLWHVPGWRVLILAGGVCLLLSRDAGWAAETATHSDTKPAPRASQMQQIAEEIAAQSQAILQQTLPTASNHAVRNGLSIVVSWSMPEPLLRDYLDQARRLGATVVLRGVRNRSLRATGEAVRQLFGERAEHAASITIDPPLVRRCQVDAVPSLVVISGEHCWRVTGAARVEVWLHELALVDRRFRPLEEWYDRQIPRLWEPNQPVGEGRPAIPALGDDRQIDVPGARWPFAEPDLEVEIKEAVAGTDWAAVQQRLADKVRAKLRAGPGLTVPAATRNRTRRVDPTMVVADEIVDPISKTVLAKAGRRVNPLTVVSLRKTYVVLDGTDPKQLAWADRWVQQPGHGPQDHVVIITNGDVGALMARWQRPVYWASSELLDRFGITAVPAAVRQDGHQLLVEEHAP